MPTNESALHRPLLDAVTDEEPRSTPSLLPSTHRASSFAPSPSYSSTYARRRSQARALLSSRAKHYFVLGLVALDVTAILADLFVALVACDLGKTDEEWVTRAREILHPFALVFSTLFVAELGVTVWAFGWRYFRDWFHCFDGVVITVSFIVDVVTRGIVEEIASIVIILRLWRLVKIIEELSVGAAERMEEIEGRVAELERENADLKRQAEGMRNPAWEDHELEQ
ncbi:uncharacterized protein THITE_2110762 [Thermothielavioides terrestris NRRL 8126]|uniref:Voltage-gated hydrogen channel 1 n=1 Tax=Thermothielavioides terrestris (strain ATCC 38088 / NRRL 8126) TaxID=578455 RepID=G2QUH4_THETT|nr:uncharacterized protein THITE_2110762 [Thermothielavioides terrestris NRRL 8126]AEO64529.1 hypothetical protein THITE_2110762 [Thermothielavioides terrestris NRRL 8126]